MMSAQSKSLIMSIVVSSGLALPIAAGGQPTGRLLIAGPDGPYQNEIHAYDLGTGAMTTFPSAEMFPGGFPERPIGMTICPDGLLYVALRSNGGVYVFNPLTGAVQGDPLPIFGQQTEGLFCLPDGKLLLIDDAQPGKIDRYLPDGTYDGLWVDAGNDIVRTLRLTPGGNVAFIYGHPAYVDTKLVEYDLDGQYLRDVIPLQPDGMYGWDFVSDTEIVVTHLDSQCIKRYNWTQPDCGMPDFLQEACPVTDKVGTSTLVVHPTDGTVYSGHISGGCIWGWSADGAEIAGANPMACYSTPFYHGYPIILADPCAPFGDLVGSGNVCVPNGVVDFDDILAVLDAFAGQPACQGSCPELP